MINLNPPQASNFAVSQDFVFWLITALLLFFTFAVAACCIFFAIKYREGSNASRKNVVHDSKIVEYVWTVPPIVLGLVVFALGAAHFVSARTPPKESMEIYVIGKRWMWHLQHPSGVRENNTLHVPLGKPVKLTMISQDVIHAFYIPAFRVQYMVVPGRYTSLWFTATKKGRYPLFCNMYCGTQHSEMGGYVYVMEPTEYAEWVKHNGENRDPNVVTMADEGHKLYDKLGCGAAACHGAVDTDHAPSLYGIAGTSRPLLNNAKAMADDEYLRESILFPDRKIAAGYQDTMPKYEERSEEDVRALIEYIKSLGNKTQTAKPGPLEPQTAPGAAAQSTTPKPPAGGTRL